jgi:endonuclease/exonuclease/phosphatase family metal-dependent hydrolase|tara:strand:+ start:1899 stop:3182 length:1284 start_codon:yes stop_codon:yes gene_type:complete
MLITTLALSLACIAPSEHHRFGLTEAMPRIEGTIRVGSYNMLNYFDQTDDPSLQGKYDDFGDNPGPTSDARCKELAKVIIELDADILALQEVESQEALAWFNENYLQDMGYTYVISEEVGYYRGIEQSLLSRFPVTEVKTWTDVDLTKVERKGGGWTEVPPSEDEITFQRSPLFVTVETPEGYELSIFVVHHKAGRNAWHRELEAVQILGYIDEMSSKNPEQNIAVIGDFNAVPWDRSTRAYFRNGMTDSISHRSKHLKWDDTSPLRITHTSGRMLDYILLNPAALDEYVIDSGFVLGSSAEEYNWREDPFPAGYASDHCAIAIDMVPREGQGNTVTAKPWPEALTKTALASSPAAPTLAATSKPSTPSKTTAANEAPFVASKNSKVFHTGTCGRKRVSEKNQVGYTSFSDATSAGKRPAKCCNPSE